MATRARQGWKLDPQGQYARQIGWKRNGNGRRVQHKFRLGADLNEARRREQRLREVWEQIEAASGATEPLWDDLSLEVARQIAKGAAQVVLAPCEDESGSDYAGRIHLAEALFPSIRFQPADMARYAAGSGRETYTVNDLLAWPTSPREEVARRLSGHDEFVRRLLSHMDAGAGQRDVRAPSGTGHTAANHAYDPLGTYEPTKFALEPHSLPSPQTLHQAMRDYIGWIEEHYFRPDLDRITNTAQTKIKQVQTLMDRHEDVPLAGVDHEAVEDMVRYWRRRPLKKGTTRQISRTSAENYISELKRFFKWLHRSKKHPWRKPEDFDGIDTRVDRDTAEAGRRLVQASVFSREELVLLNRYATPLERVFLLLGLNCGFGVAEIASLAVDEVYLFKAHSPRERELLHYETTERDSFIKRVRPKSGVYGEFILFPQTVEAMQWALARRRGQAGFGPEAPLLLNARGDRYDRPTGSGNRNQQIPNRFAALRARVRKEGHEMSDLSFGKLRKTSADLVRRFSDGEIAGVFLFHGRPVQTDDLADVYTNRPFGKVFAAIRRVEEHLRPVFEAAGPEPFASMTRE